MLKNTAVGKVSPLSPPPEGGGGGGPCPIEMGYGPAACESPALSLVVGIAVKAVTAPIGNEDFVTRLYGALSCVCLLYTSDAADE